MTGYRQTDSAPSYSRLRRAMNDLLNFVVGLDSLLTRAQMQYTLTPMLYRGCVQQSLADIRRARVKCKVLAQQLSVLVVGQSYAANARLINQLARKSLDRTPAYEYKVRNTDSAVKFELDADAVIDRNNCELAASADIEIFLRQHGISLEPSTDTQHAILPETDDIRHTHIIYKVLLGERARVHIVFEQESTVFELLTAVSLTSSASVKEVSIPT